MTRLFAPVALSLVLLAGCMSVSPMDSLSGGTARQAWLELERKATVPGTVSSYAVLRVSTPDGRRSFRATIQVDDTGRVSMSAFTPIGTEVFAFEVVQDEMLFIEHSSRKSWRGPFSDVAVQLGIPEEMQAIEFARLLFGLPAGDSNAELSEVANGVVRQGKLVYRLGGLGLEGATRDGSDWTVTYEPARFPPEKVTFSEGERSIVVRHLDLSHSRDRLDALAIDGSYTCCYMPTISGE